MDERNVQKQINEIYLSLEQKKLRKTFWLLDQILFDLQNWELNEKKNELETTYQFMLRYLTEDAEDPERYHIYEDLLRSCYRLVDLACDQWNTKNARGLYFDRKRALGHIAFDGPLASLFASIQDIAGKISLLNLLEEDEHNENRFELEKEEEALFIKIFQLVWLKEQLTLEELKLIGNFFNGKLNSYIIKCLLVSAITLTLQFSFDENKALILLQACENPEEEINQRALIGLLLFLYKYDKRIWLYPQIQNQLNHLSESEKFKTAVRDVILQFIISRETEKITQKIKDEILPEMIKISPKIVPNINDLLGDTGIEDKNPEWKDFFDKLDIKDKLQEFSELQMEGADVMHSSFSHLKIYPFFHELSNWFLPFHTNQLIFKDYRREEYAKMFEMLKESSVLCNSDKYSFFFSIAQMPEKYRKTMLEQFVSESEAMKELLKEELPGAQKKSQIVSRQYIQDLYRFYKVHPHRTEFGDIFGSEMNFIQSNNIRQIVSDKKNLMIIGEYYFNKNYYLEALSIFDDLIEEGISDDVIYQKKGYCHQIMNSLENALHAYLKAELLNEKSSWTIKKIAYCYRMLKKSEDALSYYRKAELLNPDNLSVQLNIGHCYFELKNYTEALKYYFKVEYLDRNGERAWRPIAWCSFLIGKYNQAIDYFEKIIQKQPVALDYLNYGHTQLAMGKINQAIDYYKLSMIDLNNSIEEFTKLFENDLPELIRSGINEEDISLILDRLMYDIGSK